MKGRKYLDASLCQKIPDSLDESSRYTMGAYGANMSGGNNDSSILSALTFGYFGGNENNAAGIVFCPSFHIILCLV